MNDIFKKILEGTIGAGATGGLSEVVPAAIGATQAIVGEVKKKRADAMLPANEDPEQRAMLNYVSRRRRAFDTGTANNQDRAAIRQAMQSGISSSFKYGAGSRGLNAMNQMYLQGIGNLNSTAATASLELAKQQSVMLDKIAQRKLELQMQRYDTEQARAAQMLSEGKRNLGNAIMRNISL